MLKKAHQNQLLWQLSLPQQKEVSFLLGTMHVNTPAAFKNIDLIKEKILDCSLYAAEANIDQLQRDPRVLGKMSADPGQRLNQLIPPKKYEKIRKLASKSLSIELNQFLHLRPLVLSGFIDELMMPKGNFPYALDEYLWNWARQNEKILEGVESIEDQLYVFEHIKPQEELRAFLNTFKKLDKKRKHLKKILTWYEEGNIQQLYKSSKNSIGSWRYIMLKRRNHLMAQRIVRLCQDQNSFIAIGAAHLAGKAGVLRLIKQKGLVIKPLLS